MTDETQPPVPPTPPQAERPDPYAAPTIYAPAAPVERPGRTLGIVGFILSFFGFLNIVGLILSIVGLAQSKRAGRGNGFAVAGIIISAVGIVVTVLVVALLVPTFVHLGQECAQLGIGTHHVGNTTYVCTSTSSNSYTN